MKLKRISFCNVKGAKGDYDLDDITIFAGPPFSGKTACKDAATFLLLGYLPSLGKLPSATAELASDFPMTVQGDTDTGQALIRSLERNGKSFCVKTSGNMPEVPPVLVSPGVFFEMGPTDRTKFIFSRVVMDETLFSPNAVVDSIMAVKLPEQDDAHKAVLAEIVEELSNARDERDAQEENSDPGLPTFQVWLENQIEAVKLKLKEFKAAAKRYIGHEQTSEEMNARHGETTSRPVVDIKVDIERTQSELQEHNRKRGELSQSKANQTQWRATRDNLTAIVNDPKNETLAQLIESKASERTKLQDALVAFVSSTVTHESAKREVVEAIRKAEARITEIDKASVCPENSKTIELGTNARIATSSADREVRALEKLKAEHDENLATPCCPFCGTDGPTLKDKLVARFLKQSEEIKARAEAFKAEVEKLCAEVTVERDRLKKELIAERETVVAQLPPLRTKLDELNDLLAVSRAADVDNQTDRSNFSSLTHELAKLRASAENFTKSKSTLEALSAEDMTDYDPLIVSIDSEIETRNTAIAHLQQELRDLGAAEADAARRAQAEQERSRVKAGEAVAALVVETLKDLQEKAISASVGPILKVANAFTDGLLKSSLELSAGEFGRRDNGRWISHRVFSGTEQLLAFAGISTSLASGVSPFRVVMMDELGRMDRATKIAVMGRIRQLIDSGVIEQFVGIDVTSDPYIDIPGVTVINV